MPVCQTDNRHLVIVVVTMFVLAPAAAIVQVTSCAYGFD